MKIHLLFLLLLSVVPVYMYPKDKKNSTKTMEKYEEALKKPIVKYLEQDKKARKKELEADRKFVSQEFDRAMKLYEEALQKPLVNEYSAVLHLKTARLYLTLLDYAASLPHYEAAMELNEELFTPVDVCNYLDALRYSGEKIRAIKVARSYAYRDIYKRDQRYLNILHALNYEGGFMPVGVPDYNVSRLDGVNTPYSEFWVGKMGNEFFYATSNSKFHDPSKKFYHRTKYYSLNEASEYSLKSMSGKKNSRQLLHAIPIDLQNGPLSFSDDMSKMISTAVAYDQGEQIGMSSRGMDLFKTNLLYSTYNAKRNGWSSFKLAFPQQRSVSYAHPYIFNNNRSILFASDMEGGFGGYDIYVSHWDEKLQTWGDPINLGPEVNTEGDEISPTIHEDMLIFASNGHVGFGGYDLYGIIYEKGKLLKGSLFHFDYPINTVLNDFCMLNIDSDRGYIISDRQRLYKDDVFYFERNRSAEKNNLIYGMSESQAVSNGAINLVKNEGDLNKPRKENLPKFQTAPETVLSLYFDFDQSTLTPASVMNLEDFLNRSDFSQMSSLIIDGYADEMGGENYNYRLSERRAEAVSAWLAEQGINVQTKITGKGSITIAENDIPKSDSIQFSGFQDSGLKPKNVFSDWNYRIWMNRAARRVDIKAIMK